MKRFYILCLLLGHICLYAQDLKVFTTFDEFEKEILQDRDSNTTYIINFWATWCKPCIAELPHFEQVHQAQKPNTKVYLVSLDFKNQIDSRLKPFLETKDLKSEVIALVDGKYNNWIDIIDPSWSGAIPATLMLHGDQRFFYEGEYHSDDEIWKDTTKVNIKPE